MLRQSRVYTWYVEPIDEHTNEVIAREAQGAYGLMEERGLHPQDGGEPIDAWRCQHRFIERLKVSRKKLRLHFNIYNRRGSGPLRKVNFFKRKKASRKVLRDAKKIARHVRVQAS